jgi:hypothetical protein
MFLFTGCAKQVINLSVLEPADYSISPEIKKISLLPLVGYPGRPGQFDSLTAFKPDTLCDYNKIKLGYLYGIHDVLSKSPRFTSVKIADTSYLKGSWQINKELIRQICLHDTTDAVFLIIKVVAHDFAGQMKYGEENIMQEDEFGHWNEYGYWIQSSSASDKKCVFIYRLISNFKIGIFSPKEFEYPDVITVSEIFNMYRPGECKKFRDKNTQKELLYNSCFFTGNQLGNRLTPIWKDNQKRSLYTDINPYILEGNEMAMQDNWDEAAEIWQNLAYNHKPRVESKASYNLAVKSERDDDLDMSLFWINRADSLRTSQKITSYKSVIGERIKKRTLLDQQMQ